MDHMIGRITRFASSFAALLGTSSESDIDDRTENIRDAMHAAISPFIGNQAVMPRVWRSIAVAPNIDSLWYLRSDLLAMLASHCGERSAQMEIAMLTEMFRGAVPSAQMPRASRFNKLKH
jgi:hypothetical protein